MRTYASARLHSRWFNERRCQAQSFATLATPLTRASAKSSRFQIDFLRDDLRQRNLPQPEFRHLQLKGRMLRPTRQKTDRAEISLLPSIDLEEE